MPNTITTVTNSFNTVLSNIITFLPEVITAIILLIVGLIVAWIVKVIVQKLLELIRVDRLAEHAGIPDTSERTGVPLNPSRVASTLVYWLVLFMFISAIADVLRLAILTRILEQITGYIPEVIAAVFILFVGITIANIASSVIGSIASLSRLGYQDFLAMVTKWSIIIFTILAALEQLGIAGSLINILFTGIMAALAIGFGLAIGIAFGWGGKDIVSTELRNIIQNMQQAPRQKAIQEKTRK